VFLRLSFTSSDGMNRSRWYH